MYFWENILSQTSLDIVALQDGVGAGHATASTLGTWFAAMRNAVNSAAPGASLVADDETYQVGLSVGLEPMPVSTLVSDIDATLSYVDNNWSFSYDHYYSPNSTFINASDYGNAYAEWMTDGIDSGLLPNPPSSSNEPSGHCDRPADCAAHVDPSSRREWRLGGLPSLPKW